MLGDGHEVSGTHPGYSLRRNRFDLSTPRERDRAERGRHRKALFSFLDSWRAPVGERPEDVKVAGQLLYIARPDQPGIQAQRGAVSAGLCALSQAAELHLRGLGAGRAVSRAPAEFPTASERR